MNSSVLWDCHMHSSFSADSESPMENMILEGIKKGLSGICFTEHLDPDYPDTPDQIQFELDLNSYRKAFRELKEKYKHNIELSFGIELGLQPHLSSYFHKLLIDNKDFDFVIGSSHVVHGYDPYYPDFFEGRDEAACYREYFENILENLSAFSEIDAYGHIDYIVRYGPNQNRDYSFSKYQDVLTAILEQLICKNIALEVNTGGFAYGLGQPNPCEEVIQAYRQMGGELITIGADAHKPERIAYDFQKAAELLTRCGFSHYTVYKNREPFFLPLY